jgi:hypothetical protein
MTDFRKLIEDPNGPIQFALDTPVGSVTEEAEPYPRLVVTDTHLLYVRRLVWQTLDVDARSASGQAERLTIGRLVAEIEGGGEIEMQRTVIPTDALADRPPDVTTCGACGRSIPDGEAVVIPGGDGPPAAYHPTCIESTGG